MEADDAAPLVVGVELELEANGVLDATHETDSEIRLLLHDEISGRCGISIFRIIALTWNLSKRLQYETDANWESNIYRVLRRQVGLGSLCLVFLKLMDSWYTSCKIR